MSGLLLNDGTTVRSYEQMEADNHHLISRLHDRANIELARPANI